MHTRKLLAAFTTAIAIGVAAPAWAGDDGPFDAAAFAAKPWDVTKSYYSDTAFKSFKGAKKAVVFSSITFKLQGGIAAKAVDMLGGSRTGTASSSLSMALDGISQDAMQRMADAWHAQVVAELGAMGIEVLPTDAAMASPAWAALAALDQPELRKPYTEQNWWGTGMPATFITVTAQGQPFFLDKTSGIFRAMGQASKLSQALGPGVAVVFANPVVDFVQLAASGGLLAKTASTSGKPQLQLPTSQIGFVNGYYPGGLTPKRPLIAASDYGATVEQTGGSSFSSWFTGQSSGSAAYVVKADPARYEAALGELLGAHARMFATYLKEKTK